MTLSALALAGCDGVEVNEKKTATPAAAFERSNLLQRREDERLALTRKGQGCEGRVLQGQELLGAVSGKQVVFQPSVPPQVRVYRSDGRFESSLPIGRYWVARDQLCHEVSTGETKTHWCSRLIMTDKKDLMEEVLDDRDASQLRLGCGPIKLEKLKG
jgi:hypothetical protein